MPTQAVKVREVFTQPRSDANPRPVPDKRKAAIEPLDEVAMLVTTSGGERG